MKPRFLFLLTLLTAHALSAMAQQLTVTGKVVDADQEPLIGVTVQEKDGKSGTVTDLDSMILLTWARNCSMEKGFSK